MTNGWDDDQIREFASLFAKEHKPAWLAYVPRVREALIDSFVLLTVIGTRAGAPVEEIRSLRTRLGKRLAKAHRMPNPVANVGDES